ncbi:SH3 domain-containing protein [Rhizobium ruizarguesonis]
MIEVDSGDVMQMRDESFGELLDEINRKAGQLRMSAALFWTAIVIGAIVGFASGGPGLVLCLLALPAWGIGKWFDSYRRSAVLYYDLEGDAETAYNQLSEGFDGLAKCAGKWHIEAGGAIQNLTAWKRNAGASYLVNRKATTLAYNLPSVIKSNVTPPALSVGKQIMFFMPDVVFVQDGKRIGAVRYSELSIRWQDSRFIETERVPSDANVVDHTWVHPNKSGGPDRRFKNNRQIPICLYESVHFQSDSGVNELVEFSRTGVTATFAESCRTLGSLPRERAVALPTPGTNNVMEVAPSLEPTRRRRPLRTAALVVVGILVGLPIVGMVFGSGASTSTPRPPPAATSDAPLVASPSDATTLPSQHQSSDVVATPVSELLTGASSGPSSPSNTQRAAPQELPIATKEIDVGQFPPIPAKDRERATIRYTRSAVNLREGPGAMYLVVAVIRKGVAVSIIEVEGTWSHVRIDDAVTGWMANSTISPHPP